MKKTILLATSLLLLTACGQQKSQPVDITEQLQKADITQISDETIAEITGNKDATIDRVEKFNSKEFNLSFEYPANWEIETPETNKNTDSILLIIPEYGKGRDVFINLPAKSFEEYEKIIKESIDKGEISVKANSSPTDNKKYMAKKYQGQEGHYYLIKVDKIYVGVDSDLSQKEKEQLDIMLNSISSL